MEENFKKHTIISIICGALFGIGWWLMADITIMYHEVATFKKGLLFAPAAVNTICLIINFFIPNTSLNINEESATKLQWFFRVLFCAVVTFGFLSVVGAAVLVSLDAAKDLPTYGLIGIPTVNALIFTAGLVFKVGQLDAAVD